MGRVVGESGWTRERHRVCVWMCRGNTYGVLGMWDELTHVFMNEWREMTLSAKEVTFCV